jgi:hypothetical protein
MLMGSFGVNVDVLDVENLEGKLIWKMIYKWWVFHIGLRIAIIGGYHQVLVRELKPSDDGFGMGPLKLQKSHGLSYFSSQLKAP